jgi:hypothetical protein
MMASSVGSEVAAAADPLGVLTAVAVHQLADRVLEPGVVQCVQLGRV